MIAAHRSLTDYTVPKRRRCRADVRTVEKEQTGPVLGHVGSPGHLHPSLKDTGTLLKTRDLNSRVSAFRYRDTPPHGNCSPFLGLFSVCRPVLAHLPGVSVKMNPRDPEPTARPMDLCEMGS